MDVSSFIFHYVHNGAANFEGSILAVGSLPCATYKMPPTVPPNLPTHSLREEGPED